MPTRRVHDATIYYEDSGGDGAPVLFSHGLLWSTRLFDPQVARLKSRYRCLAWDHRGQGRSSPSPESSVPMDLLCADAVELVRQLDLGPAHFVGLSMGGFVGMRLAARRPDLVRSLTLIETSADPEDPAKLARYRLLSHVARLAGVGAVVEPVMKIMFGRTALSDPAREREREGWRDEMRKNPRDVWRAVNGVIERPGVYDELSQVRAPTLVIVGDDDVATPLPKAERIAGRIAGARLERVAGAGHSSTVEAPEAVSALLDAFLASVP